MTKNTTFIKALCALTAAFTALCAAACGGSGEAAAPAQTASVTAADTAAADGETEYVDERFVGVDYGGREFRIQTSVDSTDATNANEFIEGSGEENGDVVNDTVYRRNLAVEEMLNVKLKFTHSDYTYSNADTEIRKLVMAGDDVYDLIINDCRSIIMLTDENIIYNVADVVNFDYDRDYWYSDTMNDLVLVPGHMYLLAGDYFMDVLKSCHCLYYNKKIDENRYGDPEHLDNMVLDGIWTYENATNVINENYVDLNGDGKAAEGDQFGLAGHDYWGNLIAFIGSAGITFVDRSGPEPVMDFNNERSVRFLEALNTLYHAPGTLVGIKESDDNNLGLRNLFGSGQALLVVYQRLGDLAKMRDSDIDIGPIPYPKLYESDKYYTSIHDTTEMGAIPNTCTDIDFVSTCIEVLCRETSKDVLPTYYNVALKVKYTTDEHAAQMIDLIHDNFGSSFVLAYDQVLGEFMLHSFADRVGENSTDFASKYDKGIEKSRKKMEAMIEAILAND